MKSQLLVCGARQMMYFSGWYSLTSTVHPIRVYNSQRQNDFHIVMSVEVAYLVDNLNSLVIEVLYEFFEVKLCRHTRFNM